MFAATTLFVVLAFVTLVCGFKNILVVVLEDNVFLPTLAARGVSKELHFGSRTDSIVGSLRESRLSWDIYVDHKNGPCGLDLSIADKFNFLVSDKDIRDSSVCSHVISSKPMLSYAFKTPLFGFYFPQKGSDPSWLRGFVDSMLYNPLYEETLFVFLSQVSYTDSSASLLLLGKGVQHHTESKEKTFVTNLLIAHGFSVTDQPSISNGTFPNVLNFEKIFIIVLENQPLRITLKDKNFRKFIARGTLLTDYNALINPSQPNYFALTSGDTRNCTGDDVMDASGKFIVDLFEEHGISWKAYMEEYPGNCYAGGKYGRYRRKHNPFISFAQVRENPELCSKVVNADQLHADVEANKLPKYSFYTPDMDNDGHDTGIAFAGRWLNRFLTPLMASENFMNNTLLVITFDEGIKPDNKIYTLLIGDDSGRAPRQLELHALFAFTVSRGPIFHAHPGAF